MIEQAVFTLAGVVVGSFATGLANYLFWKRQWRETVRTWEEHERRQQEARAKRERRQQQVLMTDRFREIGTQLAEVSSIPLSGPNIEQTQVNTANYLELLRLRRELLAVITVTRDIFSDNESRDWLEAFQRQVKPTIVMDPAQLSSFRQQLETIYATLRAKMDTPD